MKTLEEIVKIKAEKILSLLTNPFPLLEEQVSILIDEIIIPTLDEPDVIFWEKIKNETIKIIEDNDEKTIQIKTTMNQSDQPSKLKIGQKKTK